MGFFNGKDVLDTYKKLQLEEKTPIFNHYQKGLHKDNTKTILDYEINNNVSKNTIRVWFKKDEHTHNIIIEEAINTEFKEQSNITTGGFNYIHINQYYSLIALFIMYNLIMLNKFNVIKDIINTIVNKEINEKINAIEKLPSKTQFEELKKLNFFKDPAKNKHFNTLIKKLPKTMNIPKDRTEIDFLQYIKTELQCTIGLKAQQACSINENVMATYLTAMTDMIADTKQIYDPQPEIDIDKERNVYRIQSQCTNNNLDYPGILSKTKIKETCNVKDWLCKLTELYDFINFDDYTIDPSIKITYSPTTITGHSSQQSLQQPSQQPSQPPPQQLVDQLHFVNNLLYSDFKKNYRIYPLFKVNGDYWYDEFDAHIKFLSEKYYNPNKIFNSKLPIMKNILQSIFNSNENSDIFVEQQQKQDHEQTRHSETKEELPPQPQQQPQTQKKIETPWECKIVHVVANYEKSINYDYTGQIDLLDQIAPLAGIIG